MIDENGRSPLAKWVGPTKNQSSGLKQQFIVMHFTSGGAAESSANWFKDPSNNNSSAHFVVDRDGQILQVVETTKIAWHAGKSFWRGINGLNSYSIGIEIANWGLLTKKGDNFYTEYNRVYQGPGKPVCARHKNEPSGPERYWEPYYPAQLEAVEKLTRELLESYPTIREIVGHDDIAPGRKVDPGPAFPMKRFQALLDGAYNTADSDTLKKLDRRIVTVSSLNVRASGSTSAQVIGSLKKGDRVTVLNDTGEWSYIEDSSGNNGWVYDSYLAFA